MTNAKAPMLAVFSDVMHGLGVFVFISMATFHILTHRSIRSGLSGTGSIQEQICVTRRSVYTDKPDLHQFNCVCHAFFLIVCD
jgi:hypothetical protein